MENTLIIDDFKDSLKGIKLFEVLFNISNEGILITDTNQKIIEVNEVFSSLLGESKQNLIKTNLFSHLEYFTNNTPKQWAEMEVKIRHNKSVESVEFEKKNNKEMRYFRVKASFLESDMNNDKGVIISMWSDISEIKKNEELKNNLEIQLEKEVYTRTKELNEALEQQKYYFEQILKSSQYKNDFFTTISHELRTPLNAMIGFTELLLEEVYGPLNEKQLEFVQDIQVSAEHQFEMIKQILDLSQIEAGQMTLKIQEFSLNGMVMQILSNLKPLYKKKELKINIIGLEKDTIINADPFRFKEILINLLSNAIKYTIKGKITFIFKDKFDHWIFKVKDTGIGIARKDFGLVFREFKRVDSPYVRSTPGTGLGLSLTKRLVNLHGGDISFFSVLGSGTTFTFSLPKTKD